MSPMFFDITAHMGGRRGSRLTGSGREMVTRDPGISSAFRHAHLAGIRFPRQGWGGVSYDPGVWVLDDSLVGVVEAIRSK